MQNHFLRSQCTKPISFSSPLALDSLLSLTLPKNHKKKPIPKTRETSKSKSQDMDMEMSKSKSRRRTMWPKGTPIEVTSDEDGFAGAWYVATVLKSMKGKALVEYEALVTDEHTKERLTEHVDSAFIRPRPPDEDSTSNVFGVYDVVDALYNDGWWKGVVTKVTDVVDEKNNNRKCKTYWVVFDNPPDQHEFTASKLRFHLDWVNCTWVRPKKQMRMDGLKFSIGMDVEVNLDVQNPDNDDWFPATILEEVAFNCFLVKLSNSGNEDKSALNEATVDSFHTRPPLPDSKVKNFQLLEKVYAFHGSGWRSGFIIKILTEGRYTVMLNYNKEEKVFSLSEIRPHKDFLNNTWISYSKDKGNAAKYCELSVHAKNNANSPKATNQPECSIATIEGKTPRKHSRKLPMQQSTPYDATCKSKKGRDTTFNFVTSLSLPSKKFKRESSSNPLSLRACRVNSTLNKKPYQEVEAIIRIENESLVMEANLEEAAAENEMMLSMEDGKIPTEPPVKRQPFLSEGGVDDATKGYSAEGISYFNHMIKEVEPSVGLAEGMRGLCSVEDTMDHGYGQEQPLLSNNNAKTTEIAAQLECSSATKGNIVENTHCTNARKRTTYNAIYSRLRVKHTAHKKAKQTSPYSGTTVPPPSKKLKTENSTNLLSSLEGCAKSVLTKRSNQVAEFAISTQAKCSPHHTVCNQSSTEQERSLRENSDGINEQENGVEAETMVSVEEERIPLPSSVAKTELVQTAGVLIQEPGQQQTGVEDQMMTSVEEGSMAASSVYKSMLFQTSGGPMQESYQQEAVEMSKEEGATSPRLQDKGKLVRTADVPVLETEQQQNRVKDEIVISMEKGGMTSLQGRRELVQAAGIPMQGANLQEIGVENEMIVSVGVEGKPPSSKDESKLIQTAGVLTQVTDSLDTGVGDEMTISAELGGVPPYPLVKSQLVEAKGMLIQETDWQETMVEDELMTSVEGRGMPPHSPFNSQVVLATEDGKDKGEGGSTKEVELEHVTKEVDLSLALVEKRGSHAESSYQDFDEGINMQEANNVVALIDDEPVDNQVVPFVKSCIWDMVESLNIFQLLPQKPHFHPLAECNELEREGIAIGKMVYFATLIEKISKLQMDDPLKVFDSYLEAIAGLELYGFDVKSVVCRINGLLSVKEKEAQLQNQSKELETQIAVCIQERTEAEEDVNAIDKKICKLEEEKALAMLRKDVKDSEVTNMEMMCSCISADIWEVDHEFERIATAPW